MSIETGRDEEWLDVGSRRPRRWRHWRRVVIVLVGLMIMVLAALTVINIRPYWLARNEQLDEARVRAALITLELDDLKLRSTMDALGFGSAAERCAVLQGPGGPHRRPNRVPAVEAAGRPRGEPAGVIVTVLIMDTSETAGNRFAEVEAALADQACLSSPTLGRVGVDPPPLPDRQLAYGIAVSTGTSAGGGESWWFRARVLRYGNTVSFLSSFGPVGSADVTTDLVEALDRALATA